MDHRLTLAFTGLSVITTIPIAMANPGLPTRDLNPILQNVFLPVYVNPGSGDGWRMDHSLYISNHFQLEDRGNEQLTLDAENYRYEFGLQYRRGNWSWQARLPFSANNGGQLDSLIDGWHDFFGLPGGNRDSVPRDEVNIEYVRDGVVEFSQTHSSSGLGDLSLAVGYQPSERIAYFLGVDLPTASSSGLTGSDSVDVALWATGNTELSAKTSLYGLLGISIPAGSGELDGLLADEIWVAQAGLNYRFTDKVAGFAQLDMHTQSIDGSAINAFGNSLQMQLGLGFNDWLQNHRVELFFSEDIDAGTAPDISFGFRLVQKF